MPKKRRHMAKTSEHDVLAVRTRCPNHEFSRFPLVPSHPCVPSLTFPPNNLCLSWHCTGLSCGCLLRVKGLHVLWSSPLEFTSFSCWTIFHSAGKRQAELQAAVERARSAPLALLGIVRSFSMSILLGFLDIAICSSLLVCSCIGCVFGNTCVISLRKSWWLWFYFVVVFSRVPLANFSQLFVDFCLLHSFHSGQALLWSQTRMTHQ